MNYENIVNMYGYICSKQQKGVLVSNLIDKFNVNLKDIKDFIRVLDLFYEEIHYEIINNEDSNLFEEDLNEYIDKNSIIIIQGYAYFLKSKYNPVINSNIYEILKYYNKGNNIIDIIGKPISYKYIDKSSTDENVLGESNEIKQNIINAIVENKYIELTYKNKANSLISINGYVLGIYYDEILNEYFVILNDYLEININSIVKFHILNKKINFKVKFDVGDYLKNKACNRLVLKVYKEANVIEKINFVFRNNKYTITNKNEYIIYNILVDNPFKYINIINNFGMSVIVMEPLDLREKIITQTKNAIKCLSKKKD